MSIEDVKCPECDGPMTSRANRQTGQRFWGCNAYPKCKGTLNTDGERSTRDNSQREDESFSPSEKLRQNDRGRWRHS